MQTPPPTGASRSILAGLIASVALGSSASADYIAGDSYTIGSNPAAGQYQAGVALKSQPANLTTPGFATGPYNQGSQTSNFTATAGGLAAGLYTSPPANDGKATWLGAPADGATRSVGRAFSPTPVATSGTYWFNILVSQDGTTSPSTNGYVLGGFGNTVPPVLGTTAGNNQGLFFGFAQHGTAGDFGDLVIRYRSGGAATPNMTSDAILLSGATMNTAGVFDIVARLDVNVRPDGTDNLTYWVNPTDGRSQAALDATALVTNDNTTGPLATFALQNSSDFVRLTYSATNWTGRANFDEVRLGTTLADVVPSTVPEPGSIMLVGIGLIAGLGAFARRRTQARAR